MQVHSYVLYTGIYHYGHIALIHSSLSHWTVNVYIILQVKWWPNCIDTLNVQPFSPLDGLQDWESINTVIDLGSSWTYIWPKWDPVRMFIPWWR